MVGGVSVTSGFKHILLDASAGSQRRSLIRLSGADVARFLQGLLSADVDAIAAGQARPATVLTVKGKIVSELIALRADDGELSLAVPTDVHEAVLQKLERHVIMDDVELALEPDARFAFAWGEGLTRGRAPAGCAAFETTHPAPGLLLVGRPESIEALEGWAGRAELDAFTRHRVATASPAWGHEIRPDRFPPEVGFVHAVSYDKGCYMGQEPLSRIHARGQVNRVMARVRADALPGGDAAIELRAASRPQAGLWTTWVASEDGGCEGLAIVHRSVAEPGVALTTADGRALEVRSGPLGDDRGMGGRNDKGATVQLGRR